MKSILVLALAPGASALMAGVRPFAAPRTRLAMADQTPGMTWEEYVKQRDSGAVVGGTMDQANADMAAFIKGGGDMEFDGGDSGGGVVGDGNTDLEDQHNSASIVRGGFGAASVGAGGVNVGRGRVEGATNARVASAGANYFGRSTGLAEEKIAGITEDDRKTGRLDEVRAQQIENWFNQRAVHTANKAQGQGVVFGAQKNIERTVFNAQEALSSDVWRQGAKESEISQGDLAKHMQKLAAVPAQRLDGEEWGALEIDTSAPPTEIYEIRAGIRKTSITEIEVQNKFNTFAPYRCVFTSDSDADFTVTPHSGSMNRRSGEPVEVVVRWTPQAPKDGVTGTLVFETEDFQSVFKFVAST